MVKSRSSFLQREQKRVHLMDEQLQRRDSRPINRPDRKLPVLISILINTKVNKIIRCIRLNAE